MRPARNFPAFRRQVGIAEVLDAVFATVRCGPKPAGDQVLIMPVGPRQAGRGFRFLRRRRDGARQTLKTILRGFHYVKAPQDEGCAETNYSPHPEVLARTRSGEPRRMA